MKYFSRVKLKVAPVLGLQDFPGANRIGRHRHRPANVRRRETGRQLQRMGKQAIAEQHGDFVAPVGRQRRPAPADFRLVHHVVMHQRRQMHHLDDDRHRHMGVVNLAQRFGRQRHQRGPQMLALPVQGIIRVTNDVRVEGLDLLRQPLPDGFKERLNRINDLFPGANRLDIRGVSSRSTNHFGISRKHVRKV